MNQSDHTYSFDCYSIAFLDRARALIRRFDETEDVSCIFHAALELRLGIECRLYEYIDAAFRTLKINSEEKKEYAATKLLSELMKMNPDAMEPCTLIISQMGSTSGTGFRYTPVTRDLARMHGQLGEMLHMPFFRRNPYWYYREALSEEGYRSLTDFRRFLGDVEKELAEATSGQLLGYPQFTALVQRIVSDDNDD